MFYTENVNLLFYMYKKTIKSIKIKNVANLAATIAESLVTSNRLNDYLATEPLNINLQSQIKYKTFFLKGTLFLLFYF